MTRYRLRGNPENEDDPIKPRGGGGGGGGGGTAMRIIVPLQGVVQGRGGLVLGSVIPCALFYFLQLYLKRNRSAPPPSPPPPSGTPPSGPPPSGPPPSGELTVASELPRSLSRSHLSPRSGGPAKISIRANLIGKSDDSPYYAGLKKVSMDRYDALSNPNGVIQLGLAENQVDLFCSVDSWLYFYIN